MRSDMGRVVIESPRRGSGSPGLKIKRVGKIREDEDGVWFDGPSRIPASASRQHAIWHKLHEKSFTDVLGPIRGYLLSSVGRKWDDVYSELAKGLGAFSWPLQHILRQHIDVEINTYMVGKRVYARNRYGIDRVDVATVSFHRREFYVHPLTGLLCSPQRVKDRRPPKKGEPKAKVPGSEDRWYVLIEGLWFIGIYEKRPFAGITLVKDRFWERYDCPEVEWPHYRVTRGENYGTWFFRKIKSANKKEAAEARKLYR